MFRQLLTISRNTFTESIRQPIYTVLLIVGLLILAFTPSVSAYSMESSGDRKLLVDMGLYTVSLISVILAAFTATGVLSREIEQRTVLTVVSKPVSRPIFVLGKFLGVAASVFITFWSLSLFFMGVYRHGVMSTARDHFDLPVIGFFLGATAIALGFATITNYFYNWVFTSTLVKSLFVTFTAAFLGVLLVSKEGALQGPLFEFTVGQGELTQIAVGLVLVFEAVLIMIALSIAVSTRLGQVMTLLICIAMYLLGSISSSLSGRVNQELSLPNDLGVFQSLAAVMGADILAVQKTVYLFCKLIYLLVPNLQFFWPGDAISQGHSLIHNTEGAFSLAVLGLVSGYGVLYVTVVLAIAVLLFQRREVG